MATFFRPPLTTRRPRTEDRRVPLPWAPPNLLLSTFIPAAKPFNQLQWPRPFVATRPGRLSQGPPNLILSTFTQVASVSGQVATTLDAVTTTATGTVTLSAAVTTTLGAATLVATGSATVPGIQPWSLRWYQAKTIQ